MWIHRSGRPISRRSFLMYFSCALNLRFSLSAGIWSRPVSEDDLLKWESLAIGPALSPYAFGFFTFRMQVTCMFSRASSRRFLVFFSQSCCWTRKCRSGVKANKEKETRKKVCSIVRSRVCSRSLNSILNRYHFAREPHDKATAEG